ncbi:MAG: HAD family hydrolase [Desulfobulbaceae bacterium]|nr:HAD family hydrolase [Desulfobulbaceae bacterium]
MKTGRPAVFLDRDGTINEQMGYINHETRFILLPRTGAAIRLLNEKKIPAVVVSNQSGLARGYFPESLLHKVHDKMHGLLDKEGAHLDGVYFCPHHPEAVVAEFRKKCDCRKPKPGLMIQAARELGLDLSRSYVVGDRWSDLKAAAECNAAGILVLTGYGRGDHKYIGPSQEIQPHYIAEDLLDAAEWIIRDLEKVKGFHVQDSNVKSFCPPNPEPLNP